MKTISLLFALLTGCLALNVQAAEFFMGADVAPYVSWKECKYIIACSGGEYDGHSNGYGIHAGVWLPNENGDRSGLEIGYDKPGGTSGSKEYSLIPGCIILCPGAFASWKNEAKIVYVDWIGYATSPQSRESGAVFGKIGIYSSSVKTEGNYGVGGGTYSRQVSGTGLMLGAGYAFPMTRHIVGRAATDMYFNVKVANPIDAGDSLSAMLVRFSIGLDYIF